MKVTLLTPIPSPYQVELIDAVAGSSALRPRVVFVERKGRDRQWVVQPPAAEHIYLEDGPAAFATAADWVRSADLFVASWYVDPSARKLIANRAATGKPWVFWGERPGFSRWGLLGRLRRRWHLSTLLKSAVPIWGIGSWAVDAWRREFGGRRAYQNLPYFSDLSRFAPPTDRRLPGDGGVRFLYSGSLIKRKGVDLLATAFAHVAATREDVRLEIVGAGELEPLLRAKLCGLVARVTFSGFCPWAHLPAAYHRADVLVAPSRYDGWGLIVPEGLAAGLAVIGSDRTGAALELIEPGLNGWRVSAGDVASLTRAMAEAADLPAAQLRTMSAAARESVADHSLVVGAHRFAAAARAAVEGWTGENTARDVVARTR